VLDLLGRLVDHSLVVRRGDQGDAEPSFAMLETIREFGLEQLAEAHEELAVRARHRDWFLAMAEQVPPEQLDPAHVAWLEREQDNLRAALRWSIQAGDAGAGVRLGVAVWPLWYLRNRYSEGRAWFAELLGMPPTSGPSRCRALAFAGYLAFAQGDHAEAESCSAPGRCTRVRELTRRAAPCAGCCWATWPARGVTWRGPPTCSRPPGRRWNTRAVRCGAPRPACCSG
jgi:hypothetical protein